MNSKLICANGQGGENQGQENLHIQSVLCPPGQHKWHSGNPDLDSFISKTKLFYGWLVRAGFLEEAEAPTLHRKDGSLLSVSESSYAYVFQI